MRSANLLTFSRLLLVGPMALVLATCGGDSGTDPGPTPPVFFTLTVQVSGDGTGTVTSVPAGIACSSADGACTATFEQSTAVTFTATPDGANAFAGWSDSCSGTAACSVTISGDATVGAEFDDVTVSTEIVGTAAASVQSPDGSLGLTFPAGALTSDQAITVRGFEPSQLTGALATLRDQVGITSAFQFGPDGLAFSQPVTMVFETGTTVQPVAGAYTVGVALLTGEATSTTEILDQTLAIDAATGALTIEGELTHFSKLTPVDNLLSILVNSPQFVVGAQANVTTSIGVPTDFGGLFPLTDFSAFYVDAGSVNVVPGFEGQFPLEVGGNGNQWGGAPSYTCSAEGTGTLNYEFRLLHSGGGTVVHRFNQEVNCSAVPPETLDIVFTGTGGGSVTSVPAGIDCASDATSCSAQFPAGSEITLTAVPAAGSDFCGWADGQGASLGTNLTFSVGLTASQTIQSCFDPQPTLTLVFAGTGGGGVTSDPVGLADCLSGGSTCQAQFPAGTDVTLQANPASDSNFCGWSNPGGSSLGTNAAFTVSLGADQTIEACFNQRPPDSYVWSVDQFPVSGSQINAGTYAAVFTDVANMSRSVEFPMTVINRVFVDPTRNVLGLDVNAPILFNATLPVATGIQAPEIFSFLITGSSNTGSAPILIETRNAANQTVGSQVLTINNGSHFVSMNTSVTPIMVLTNQSSFYFFDFLLEMQFLPCSGSSCNQ